MARINKTTRNFAYPVVALGLAYACGRALELVVGMGAILFYLPLFIYFALFSPVDSFDFWLRKRTRDEYWLPTHEGHDWLASPEGKAWLKTPKGQSWLSSTNGQYWSREQDQKINHT